ncbi:MAG TPA: hypothetical protein VKT52_00255 [Ktedonobacterales bacterium]|nr:hypothetical protein [Ktedonobacterales bacterium]
MNDDVPELIYQWSAIYRPEWDAIPEKYVECGLVGWGSSRRLARIADPARAFKAYFGVQHFDPGRWNLPGEPASKFFLSLFVRNRTVTLRTFPTLAAARAELERFHASLPRKITPNA